MLSFIWELLAKSWYDKDFSKCFLPKCLGIKKISKPWLHHFYSLLWFAVKADLGKLAGCLIAGNLSPLSLQEKYSDVPGFANVSQLYLWRSLSRIHFPCTHEVCLLRLKVSSFFWLLIWFPTCWEVNWDCLHWPAKCQRMDFSLQSYSKENKTVWKRILSIDLEMVEKSWIW